jgi:choline kinase
MYKLDKNTTVLQRMVGFIRKYDRGARIVAVTGFAHETLEHGVEGASFLFNPFFAVTNSIASLWFAREYMDDEQITIINGDVVLEEKLIAEKLCKPVDRPMVFLDSSIKNDGDYNVQVNGDNVVVMSKELQVYYGEYAGITKLDRDSAKLLKEEVCTMVENSMYDQWYENALVQMIFNHDFSLKYEDICTYSWTEVDCVGDLLMAKKIHLSDLK